MADGSHLCFIQKPVTFELFEITKPNLVSRLSTNPEFSQILIFSVFWKSKMADGRQLGFIQKPVTFEPFENNRAKFGIQTQYKPRIQPDFEIFSFLEIQDGGWQPSWLHSEACNF